MPDLSKEQLKKLDDNIQAMIQGGASNEDIVKYTEDFKKTFGSEKKKEPTASPSFSMLDSAGGTSESDSGESGQPEWKKQFSQAGKSVQAAPPVTPLQIPNQQQGLSAAGTMGQTPVDQTKYNPNLQKYIDLPGGEMGTAFGRGATNLLSSVLKSPAFVMDVAAKALPQNWNQDIYTLSDKNIAGLTDLTNALDEAVSNDQKLQAERYDKSISEYIGAGDYKRASQLIGNSISESLPAMGAIMMGQAGGMSQLQTILGGTAVFGADKMSQLNEENPEMSQDQKLVNATLTGLAEGVFEGTFGSVKVPGMVMKAIEGKAPKQAMKEAESMFKEIYAPAFKKYFGNTFEESLSEGATTFAQNAVDIMTGAAENKKENWFKGVPDAMIVGGAMGTGFATPAALIEVAHTKAERAKAARYEDQRNAIHEDLKNEDVAPETKKVLTDKLKELNEKEADDIKKTDERFDKLLPEEQKQITDLLQRQKPFIDAASDENVNQFTRDMMQKEADALDTEIDKIYETAAQRADNEAQDELKQELSFIKEQEKEFGFLDNFQKERKAQLEEMFKAPEVKESVTVEAPAKEPVAEPQQKESQKVDFDAKFAEIYDTLNKQGKITKKGDCP